MNRIPFDGVNLLVNRDIAFKYAGTLGNGILMEIEYDGDAIMLARSLNKSNLCKNMGLKVKNISKNKIILKSN